MFTGPEKRRTVIVRDFLKLADEFLEKQLSL
jgi:hypothetical protein